VPDLAPVQHGPRRSLSRIGAGLGAVAASGVGAFALANVQTRHFVVRQEQLAILPRGQKPRRVLHLSDIHMVPGQDTKTLWLRQLADLEPDLVVNTGDNLSHRRGVDALLHALEPLMRFPGVFVPGSNCYFVPRPKSPVRYFKRSAPGRDPRGAKDELDWRRMHRAFALAGWQDASNRALSMPLGGLRLDVTGVDDPHLGFDEFQGWPRGSSTASESPHLRLALAHAPYRHVLDTFARAEADLVLAGHTHGGQVRSPGYGALVSNCDLPTGLASGLSWWQFDGHRVPVNVSAGLGASRMAPVRVDCAPEAVLLTLTPRD
jgi:predicted MPP superfamily phosphohydrolase